MFVTDHRTHSIITVLLAAAAAACADAAAPPDLRSPAEAVPPKPLAPDPRTPAPLPSLTQLLVSGGDAQQAPEGHSLPLPLQVRAVDASGSAVAGVVVHFGITAGGGTIAGATATTGLDGVATSGAWTLGTAAQPQRVVAHAHGLQALFTATADKLPSVRGVYDLTATIRSYDAAWGVDMDGASYVAVVTVGADTEDAAVLETAFDGWRGLFPDWSFDLAATSGTARFTTPAQLEIEMGRLWWSMRGTLLESGDIEGTWGCCGHISGTFTMRRRASP